MSIQVNFGSSEHSESDVFGPGRNGAILSAALLATAAASGAAVALPKKQEEHCRDVFFPEQVCPLHGVGELTKSEYKKHYVAPNHPDKKRGNDAVSAQFNECLGVDWKTPVYCSDAIETKKNQNNQEQSGVHYTPSKKTSIEIYLDKQKQKAEAKEEFRKNHPYISKLFNY